MVRRLATGEDTSSLQQCLAALQEVVCVTRSEAPFGLRPRHRWLAIVASTVALRTAIVPITVMQMKNTAKLTVRLLSRQATPACAPLTHRRQLARPEMERLQTRMKSQARQMWPLGALACVELMCLARCLCPDERPRRCEDVSARSCGSMAKVCDGARAHWRRTRRAHGCCDRLNCQQVRLQPVQVISATAGTGPAVHLLLSGH